MWGVSYPSRPEGWHGLKRRTTVSEASAQSSIEFYASVLWCVTSCACVVWVLSAAKPVAVSSKSKKSKPPGTKKGPKGQTGTTAASHTYDKVGAHNHTQIHTQTQSTHARPAAAL